jgi:hypothetical protein
VGAEAALPQGDGAGRVGGRGDAGGVAAFAGQLAAGGAEGGEDVGGLGGGEVDQEAFDQPGGGPDERATLHRLILRALDLPDSRATGQPGDH